MPNFPIEAYLEANKPRKPDAAYIAPALAGGVNAYTTARDAKKQQGINAMGILINKGFEPVIVKPDGTKESVDILGLITGNIPPPQNLTWHKSDKKVTIDQFQADLIKKQTGISVLAGTEIDEKQLNNLIKPYKEPVTTGTSGKSLTQIEAEARAKALGTASVSPQKAQNEITKKELASMTNVLPKLDQAFQSVGQLEELYYKGVKPASVEKGDIIGGLGARAQGVLSRGASIAGAAPNVNRYLANRKGFSGLIAKGGFGEAGMLTQQDIDRVVDLLPNPGSTAEEAKIAFEEVKKILYAARDRYQKKYEEVTGQKYNMQSEQPTQSALPSVGSTFQGGKVLSIKRVQ